MNQDQEKLVESITREVVAALGDRALKAKSGGSDRVAAIRPPAGTCTGDYSRFEELGGRLMGGIDADDSIGQGEKGLVSTSAVEPIPLVGIVTARQLQEAMDAAPDGVALVGTDARLTPLANDLVRQDPQKMRRGLAASPGSPLGVEGTKLARNQAWLWWVDGECPAAFAIARQQAGSLRPTGGGSRPDVLGQVVREVAAALRAGRIAGAILFVKTAARAMCFANRCGPIRAVVGTCGEAVEQGLSELGANVLVIEYPHVGPRAMAAMVERMLQQAPSASAQVQRELAELQRC